MDIAKLDLNMAVKDPEQNLYWYDASQLTIAGKGWQDTESVYSRFPARAKGVVREPVWELSKCPAGLSIHFTTNTSSLAVKWDGCGAMDHMPATGVSGLDLYLRHDGEWRWLATGRPVEASNTNELFTDLPSESRKYMLYLPLYASLDKVELGIPAEFDLQPTALSEKKSIVFYGTSITQGGCASRPGMCYTAILGRWLDNPTINLGFSGNGIMESEVIDLLCELDPAIYVLDNLPNMGELAIKQREEDAIRKLRSARPEVPIVLIDNPFYCNAYVISSRLEGYLSSNAAQYAIYKKLRREGDQNLHYIKDNDLIGSDGEATVDGIHFTDLGYMRFSEKLVEPLRQILQK